MKKKKKFEIELYDEIQVGENIDNIQLQKVVMEHPIIIEAADKKELDEHAARFKLCKQRMKIVRVINDDNTSENTNNEDLSAISFEQPQQYCNSNANMHRENNIEQQKQINAVATKPRYYTISGIEIKDDNGKIYQKQWMRLTDAESQNFRLVNDSNNKITNIKGKHFEMKKWVLVDIKETDDTEIIVESLENEKI